MVHQTVNKRAQAFKTGKGQSVIEHHALPKLLQTFPHEIDGMKKFRTRLATEPASLL
jgi:hypothetical protein